MLVILAGSIAVWGIVTGMTGGNWQAGLLVAFMVLCVCTSGLRATARQAEEEAEYILVRKPEEDSRWWRR